MDSFDKKIKHVFENTDEVPNDFNWEDMEAGIMEKMNPPFGPMFLNWKWIGSLGVVLVLGLIAYQYGFKSNDHKTEIVINTNKIPTPIVAGKSIDQNEKDQDMFTPNSVTNNKITRNESNSDIVLKGAVEHKESIAGNNLKFDQIGSRSMGASHSSETYDDENAKIVNRIEESNQLGIINSLGKNDIDIRTVNTSDLKANTASAYMNYKPRENRDISVKPILAVDKALSNQVLSPISSRVSSVSRLSTDIVCTLERSDARLSTTIPKIGISGLSIELASGVNMLTGHFESSDLMNLHHSPNLGLSSSMSLLYSTDKWDFSMGYGHNYTRSFLSYQDQSMVSKEFKNTLISTTTPAYEGLSIIHTYGDTTVQRLRTIDYVNYNTVTTQVLKLGATRKFDITKRLNIGVGLGVYYTMTSAAKGVFLNEDKSYTRYDQKGLGSNFGLSTQLRLQYGLSDRWSVIGGFSGSRTIGNWVINKTNFTNSTIISTMLGVRYKFK